MPNLADRRPDLGPSGLLASVGLMVRLVNKPIFVNTEISMWKLDVEPGPVAVAPFLSVPRLLLQQGGSQLQSIRRGAKSTQKNNNTGHYYLL